MLTLSRSGSIASRMWKNVDAAEKKYWQDKADEAKAEHARLHPNYEVKPRKSSEISRRNGSKTAEKATKKSAKKSSKKEAVTPVVNHQPPVADPLQQPVHAPMAAQQPFQPYGAQQSFYPPPPAIQQPAQPYAAGLPQPTYEVPNYNLGNVGGPGFGMPAQYPGYQPMARPFFANGNYQNAGVMPQEGFGEYNNPQFRQVGADENYLGGMGFGMGQPGNNGWH